MEARATQELDVLAIGRIGVDVYPMQVGRGLEDVETFGKFLGGSATNVSVAAARLGHSAGIISAVGADPFGRFLLRELGTLGVAADHVKVVDDRPTPVTFCEVFPPDDFPLYFYRLPKAPDLLIQPTDLPLPQVRGATVFWATLTGLSVDPSRTTHLAAWRERGRRRHTIIDLDYREMFWSSRHAATEQAALALQRCTVAIGNRQECEIAVGESDPHRAGRALLERGIELAIVKRGPAGVVAMTDEETVEVPAFKVDIVNGLGAGDAFGGAVCHGLLQGWDLRRIIEFANAAGGLVASRLECSTAMPTADQVQALLDAGERR